MPIAQQKANTIRWEADTTQQEANTAQQRANASQQRANTAQQKVSAVQQKVTTVQQKAITIQQKAATAQQKVATALHEAAATRNTAAVKAEAVISATTPLYNLAIDSLQLSMHFFHPIQQSAQQIYHSALPLSPTLSHLRKSCLQSVIDNQLSHVTAFLGVPDTWGLLLRTIDTRLEQITFMTTFAQNIAVACEDVVNIYSAVTGVLQQSLQAPEVVIKIQGSPDGSILFFAHTFSVTMWDVQTGGLIYTFTKRSKINDIAVSTTGAHIACSLFDESVITWNIHTKVQARDFWVGKPVVAICWLSPLELAIATQAAVYVYDGKTSHSLFIDNPVWGMVYLVDKGEILVGSLYPEQELYYFEVIEYREGQLKKGQRGETTRQQQAYPILVGEEIMCITPPSGVQLFNTKSDHWTNSPPLLSAAASVAVSLNRNLVVQTKGTIQIFSIDVLTSGNTLSNIPSSHIYPLGEKHIICILQANRHLILLELETLQEIHPENSTLSPNSLPTNQSHSVCGSSSGRLVAELGISAVMQVWKSGTPLPEWIDTTKEGAPLSRLSPNHTWVAMVYTSPHQEVCIRHMRDGTILTKMHLRHDLGMGEVYDITFDSETRFYLKIAGPGLHVQIPYNIVSSLFGSYSMTRGEPEPLSEPQATPPYTLNANCEWVLDAQSRKICWISPGDMRRGNGGHFWAGLSLVMVGDDGVVKKLSFKEPGC